MRVETPVSLRVGAIPPGPEPSRRASRIVVSGVVPHGWHGMLDAHVYTIYQARGAGAGAGTDQAGELQYAPTSLNMPP